MSEASHALNDPWSTLARQRAAMSFGVWVFLASEVLFFGGALLGYTIYRDLYPDAFRLAARETDIVYGTLNTAILLTSSLTMFVAERSAHEGFRKTSLWCLAATLALGSAFLVVKGFEYYDDIAKGLFPGPAFPLQPAQTQIFWAFYWVMTGVHAIHLILGLGILAAITVLLYRRGLPPQSPSFQGLALYWHFVDSVWVVLLPLLYLIGRA
ncbi:MAG TPA: cytochrome c oxidase subunit 3 [Pseudolabrys sp.]|nr:cytochrome c oxidase subunit 3 [Pseudolabrys sp.]